MDKIRELVWDMTIGAGFDGPMGSLTIPWIEARMGRKLTEAEERFVRREWNSCLQAMGQP